MNSKYLFTSQRLGIRNWRDGDLEEFAAMNADSSVMEFFPFHLTTAETEKFMNRLRHDFDTHGYCYYAVEMLDSCEFIGFIGLSYQDYASEFNPSTDIGWRLKKSSWGQGFATEGATRCLAYAFEELNLDAVTSVCTISNHKSEHVMKKIGMRKMGEFNHPKLKDYPEYEKCMWYMISKSDFKNRLQIS